MPSLSDSAQGVSVIAINYNGGLVIGRFVDSIWAADTAPLEVIVVDNASSDGSLEVLRGRSDITLVESGENLGFGRGCNLGAQHARADMLLFCNPDVQLYPDTLACLVRDLRAAPEAAIVVPALDEPMHPAHVREPRVEEVAAMAGAIMLVDRAHFDAVGGFDPSIFLYSEDTDLCYRTWLAGRRVLKDWDAVAAHDVHGSGGGHRWSGEQIRNGLYVHLKLRAWRPTLRYSGRMAIKTVVRGLRYRDASVLVAWWANVRAIRATLANRRAILGASTPADRERLERLAAEHMYWSRRNWRMAVRRAARRHLGG